MDTMEMANGIVSWRRTSDKMDGCDFSVSDGEYVHVLAVDDSLVDRKVIERLLKISSCKVTAVESGTRALQILGLADENCTSDLDDSLKVDLIITDYCMPGMTGYDLLKKIKESSALRRIPVVIMSSENVLARIKRCLEEGAEDFIVKPVKLADVKRIMESMARDLKAGNEMQEINIMESVARDMKASNKMQEINIMESIARDMKAGNKMQEINGKENNLQETCDCDDHPSSSPMSISLPSSPTLSISPPLLSSSSSSSAPCSPSSLDSPTRQLKMSTSD